MRHTLAGALLLALTTIVGAGAGTACVGTTGGDLVTFHAYASGVAGVDWTKPFTSGRGYQVVLTRAKLHVGAVYLNRTVPISGKNPSSCIIGGDPQDTYVAEVVKGLDVDVLSSTPQPFPIAGDGTERRAVTGEVWLTGGDIDAKDDSTVVLDVAGTATKGTDVYPFEARFTIGQNRALAVTDATRPGANPICKQRIATPIEIDVTPRDGGTLTLQVDPRGWFANVDFAQVPKVSDAPALYRFVDSSALSTDAASRNLFNALRSSFGVYSFTFR
jgi:hypothetical protein